MTHRADGESLTLKILKLNRLRRQSGAFLFCLGGGHFGPLGGRMAVVEEGRVELGERGVRN